MRHGVPNGNAVSNGYALPYTNVHPNLHAGPAHAHTDPNIHSQSDWHIYTYFESHTDTITNASFIAHAGYLSNAFTAAPANAERLLFHSKTARGL